MKNEAAQPFQNSNTFWVSGRLFRQSNLEQTKDVL